MQLNRKHFVKLMAAGGLFAGISPQLLLAAELSPELEQLLIKAGNLNDEKERAELFGGAVSSGSYSEEEKEILEKLYFVSDRWANGFEKYANPGSEGNEMSGYLCGFLNRCKIDRFYFPQLEEDDPFFPLIAFYRSRMLLAHLIQNGKISMVPENREMYINESVRLFKKAAKAYPENKLIKTYLGDFEPWEELVEEDPKAPAWANYQRMTLEKLTHLIHWWIDNRQISDGQFGGGWGDDVEMWRNWVAVLFAFDDAKAVASQEKLFEGLYGLSRMEKGYTTFLNDVEHTSEEYADPLTCMLNMQPENPVWEERALKVMDFIENIWTGINERGNLQFKSTWFNVDEVHPDVKRACDTPYHTRLIQPLMLVWLRTGNERISGFIKNWLKTWVDATFIEEDGKPEGIIPAAIHWPDGRPTGGEKWWKPENYHTPLYHFPSQQANMYDCLLQAYYITRDKYYLKPLQFVAEKRMQGVGDGNSSGYVKGSMEWAISELKKSIPQILIKYRMLTGDTTYDSILKRDAGGYAKFLFDKDMDALTDTMLNLKKSFSLPEEFFTTEVRWTDRLFAASGKYFRYTMDEPIPSFSGTLLFSGLTGNVGNYKILPVFGVKWFTKSTDIAILVETNSPETFEAKLYHFGEKPRKMGARFYNLEEGTYLLSIDGNKAGTIKVSDNSRDAMFELPVQKLVQLKMVQK